MVDPEEMLIVAPRGKNGPMSDRTGDVVDVKLDSRKRLVEIRYNTGGKSFPYRHPRARLLRPRYSYDLPPDEVAVLPGDCLAPPLIITIFTDEWDETFSMVRVSWNAGGASQESRSCHVKDFFKMKSSARSGDSARILQYLHQVVACLNPDGQSQSGGKNEDPLSGTYKRMNFVHPDSALAAYMEARNSATSFPDGPVILPFRSNEDQREAIAKALHHRVSVIEGPPGTGKTETILNLIANILLVPGQTVGVVSFGNAAVDNVRDKLEEAGIDFVAARVGDKKRVDRFLHDQDHEGEDTGVIRESRNTRLSKWLARPPIALPLPPADAVSDGGEYSHPAPAADPFDQVSASERRLVSIWRAQRELAQVRNLIDSYALESAHLERRTEEDDLPDLADLPLLRKDSERILDYLAETRIRPDLPGGVRGLLPRFQRYFRYGRLKDLDPTDAATVLSLERAFYTHRIEELREEERQLQGQLEGLSADEVKRHHAALSQGLLNRALRQHYEGRRRECFDDEDRTISRYTREFLHEYPVVLTTCHSIRWNLAEGTLLDWVIIDEATQTNLLTAALAMSRARNVVIVGDLKQLGHILDKKRMRAGEILPEPPFPEYDVEAHSILSSVVDAYGAELPHTMLREHYRCVPAIIEFCNQMYYNGALIPCRPANPPHGPAPLEVRRTSPGNHARTNSRGSARGTYNQREIDDIDDYLDGVSDSAGVDRKMREVQIGGDYELGVTTPYRLQADRLAEALARRSERDSQCYWLSETVHKFQGRGAREMVLSTVVDETRLGHMKLRFVDDPRLINVAVSRAKDRFVLVTNHDGVPRSTHIKALVDYIRFQDPDQVVDSRIVSVFDLLYSEYSERLNHFAARIHGDSKYLSENIIWTLLDDILSGPVYEHLAAAPQVRLRDLLPDISLLDERQRRFVRSVSAVDFTIYHKVTRRLLLAIEVNGTAFHENNPAQLARDKIKKSILAAYGVDVLELPTNGSGEERRIRDRLDALLPRRSQEPKAFQGRVWS